MTTGVDHVALDQLNSNMEATRTNIEEEANTTRQIIAQMTGDGLQGVAAEASDALSSEVQITLNNTNGIINRLQQEAGAYAEDLTGSDGRSASQIGGV